MKKMIRILLLLVVLGSISYGINYGASSFSNYAIREYLRSEDNPARSLTENGRLKPEVVSALREHAPKIEAANEMVRGIKFYIGCGNILLQALTWLLLVLMVVRTVRKDA